MFLIFFSRINLPNKRDNFRVRFYIKISFLILSLRIFQGLKRNIMNLNLRIRLNVTQSNRYIYETVWKNLRKIKKNS